MKFERTHVYNFEEALYGMRLPLMSHSKSDSVSCVLAECGECPFDDGPYDQCGMTYYIIGPNDMDLCQRLISAGPEHRKFLRQISVAVTITAPLYWWKEYDTYKVGTVANSCSTMHKIQAKEFVLSDFSTEHLSATNLIVFSMVIDAMNNARLDFLQRKDKKDWWQMIQMLPTCYNQKRTVQLNYAVLKNMYHSRQNHKLDEWREFCKWVETLPYSQLITG